ncbi:hypothetical protein M758_8G192100 [Ceratodon purpureus]|uniref:Secreted protein n=1 Tax=Ceratodon purpureus TaxID=3225 RepID=A0A8T0H548_CERPU|nr:hypothetical protein KC19_8G197100 [Ceratodon purpureus]KAG0609536.1 hypothetical protein M758_8G192100 [Ceratodon purpureus]
MCSTFFTGALLVWTFTITNTCTTGGCSTLTSTGPMAPHCPVCTSTSSPPTPLLPDLNNSLPSWKVTLSCAMLRSTNSTEKLLLLLFPSPTTDSTDATLEL